MDEQDEPYQFTRTIPTDNTDLITCPHCASDVECYNCGAELVLTMSQSVITHYTTKLVDEQQ